MFRLINKGRGQVLEYDSYVYKKNKTKATRVYFECTNSHCSSRLHTDPLITRVIREPTDHNHLEEDENIRILHLCNEMKTIISADPARGIALAYENVASRNATYIPAYDKFRSILYRHRNTLLPTIPRDIMAVNFIGIG